MVDARGGVNGALQRRAIRHALYWQRLRAQQVRDITAFLQANVAGPVRRRLEERLAQIEARGGVDRGPVTTARLQELDHAIRDIVADGLRRGADRSAESLVAMGNYETEWQVAQMRAATPIQWDFATPAPGLLRAAVQSQPFEGRVLREWWGGIAGEAQARISRELRAGLVEGQTTPQIVARIIGDENQRGVLGLARRQVEAVTRTAANFVATEARRETFEANDDIVEGWQFVATLDLRTTLICASEDGKVYRVGEGRQPPLHFNALAAGTLIRTRRGSVPIEEVTLSDVVLTHAGRWRCVYAVMSKCEPGPIRVLRTATGGILRVTDEHPILTVDGWKRADEVRLGDQVFEDPEQLSESRRTLGFATEQGVVLDAHNRPAKFDEPAVPYRVLVAPARMPSTVKFERNATLYEGEVDDVGRNGVLELERYPGRSQRGHQLALAARGSRAVARRHRDGTTRQASDVFRGIPCRHRFGVPTGETSRRFDVPGAPVFLSDGPHEAREVQPDRFDASSNGDSVPLAPPVEHARRDVELALDGPYRLPACEVAIVDDRLNGRAVREVGRHWLRSAIVGVGADTNAGLVWNLAVEDDETYVAAGIVVHNCRSTTSPVLKSWKDLGIPLREIPPSTRASMNGQVPERTTYEEWLRGEPKHVQVEALGKARAEAFRAGTGLARFVTSDGRVLTLDELRAADALH